MVSFRDGIQHFRRRAAFAAAAATTLALVAPAIAQADGAVSWVSGTGDDVQPCTRTAPCKTFAGAQSKTNAGGTIRVLDPGGYGGLTINKALTIDAGGVYASAVTTNGSGPDIVVNAGAGHDVVLRGLDLTGVPACTAPGATHGVKFVSGRSLVLDDMTIHGFSGNAVDVEPSSAGGSVTVSNSDISSNCRAGLFASAANGASALLSDSFISHNGTGVHAGAGGNVQIARNTIVANGTGLAADGGGVLATYHDNRVGGNSVDGAPTTDLRPPPPPPAPNTQIVTQTQTVFVPQSTQPGPTGVKPHCHVPRLRGLTLGRVRRALVRAHCQLGKISYHRHRGMKHGRVYRQRPHAGADMPAATKVSVKIAGKRPRKRAHVSAAIANGPVRTWVSGTGDDANPCSRVAPCRTFQGALATTLDGGVISVLDAGNYGAVTINQPVTIDGGGASAAVFVGAGQSAITVDAGAGNDVTLRNIDLLNTAGCSAPGSGSGVRFVTGGALHLEGVTADSFAGSGVELAPTAGGPVTVHGGSLSDNCTAGMSAAMPGGSLTVTAAGLAISHNGTGIAAGDGARVLLTGNTITANTTGLAASGSGAFASWGDDAIGGNADDGVKPETLPLM